MRFIFVTGGVVSSVGKGIAAASIAGLLQSRGFKIVIRKMDPYLNVDPGTMSPYEHGEVFVTEDGAETDLDLGHYERLTGVNSSSPDSISSGQIFEDLIKKERQGVFLGKTVQVIPHVTDEIKARLVNSLPEGTDFVICEIGGTVGDIEANPFLEAIRQFAHEKGRGRVIFVHVTLLPYLKSAKEIKTKPTQHSIKELQRSGIIPNILVCRSEVPFGNNEIKKLALFCNVDCEDVIPALDAPSLSEAILSFADSGIDSRILSHFERFSNYKVVPQTSNKPPVTLDFWRSVAKREQALKEDAKVSPLKVAIVAKYLQNKDAYISLQAALEHAAYSLGLTLDILRVDSATLEKTNSEEILHGVSGILVPGGYGKRGIEGKINALTYGREHQIPTLGICLGSQLMVIEALRNLVGLPDVGSAEFGTYQHYGVSLLSSWQHRSQGEEVQTKTSQPNMGGTMRLGSYQCVITPNTLAAKVYKDLHISERHRHRYEINMRYQDQLAAKGLIISGFSPDGKLPEIVELLNHAFYIGVQFHPEFKSRLFNPHPLFVKFLQAQQVKDA